MLSPGELARSDPPYAPARDLRATPRGPDATARTRELTTPPRPEGNPP